MNAGFVNAAEMLPLPKSAHLGIKKLDGKVCVWCGKKPSPPVKLGPRIRPVEGSLLQWFPVGCRPCAGAKAIRVYQLHVRTCARCTHRDYCPDSQSLHDLALMCG